MSALSLKIAGEGIAGAAAGIALALFCAASSSAAAPDDYRTGSERFIADISARQGFDADALRRLLARASYRQSIVDAMRRPYEGKPWRDYRTLFLTPDRIREGVRFWQNNAETLERAESTYGVKPEIIVAIIGIETNYGANLGSYPILDALTTLGFAYPPRADFFRAELEEFLLLTREEDIDPLTATGSYAGAMGKPQFIASSYRDYAVDFDGDGKRDLWNSDPDVIGSVANYFSRHGWRAGESTAHRTRLADEPPVALTIAEKRPLAPNLTAGALRDAGFDWNVNLPADTRVTLMRLDGDGDEYWIGLANFYVITRYNHSNLYAMAVHQLSEAIRTGHLGES
ncbi:lytic murein transglycosylase B [Imhoffiella purpurea]|uniref:Membrane-bound lytic murein transglycosylase B n=1 Tax=Imhoffiella purpurea TaxID=1249627 RepID=W9VCP9_9GAMM|nr:lytic murein transglycosylase B [Imhoffiella purpurea]EXJ17234.1 Membrane-bound lytic murein transglycosylase B precursor [Imhoffiella purpurea]